MAWSAVNQFVEQRGGAVFLTMTIRKIDDVNGWILGQRCITATTGENNPNLKDVLTQQLQQKADIAKIEIDKEIGSVVTITDLTADVTAYMNA